jgi:hypothetical protein
MKRIILALLVMQIISSKMIWLGDVGNPGARYPVNDIYDGKDDPSKQG